MNARFLGQPKLTADDRQVSTIGLTVRDHEQDAVTLGPGRQGLETELNPISHRSATVCPGVREAPLHGPQRFVERLEHVMGDAVYRWQPPWRASA